MFAEDMYLDGLTWRQKLSLDQLITINYILYMHGYVDCTISVYELITQQLKLIKKYFR